MGKLNKDLYNSDWNVPIKLKTRIRFSTTEGSHDVPRDKTYKSCYV